MCQLVFGILQNWCNCQELPHVLTYMYKLYLQLGRIQCREKGFVEECLDAHIASMLMWWELCLPARTIITGGGVASWERFLWQSKCWWSLSTTTTTNYLSYTQGIVSACTGVAEVGFCAYRRSSSDQKRSGSSSFLARGGGGWWGENFDLVWLAKVHLLCQEFLRLTLVLLKLDLKRVVGELIGVLVFVVAAIIPGATPSSSLLISKLLLLVSIRIDCTIAPITLSFWKFYLRSL